MKYFVTLHDETLEVELDSERDGSTRARVGGRECRLTLHPIDGLAHAALRLESADGRDGRLHDVLLEEDSRGMHVTIDGQRCAVLVEDQRERAAHLATGGIAKGPVTLKSLMPGILRAVLVKPGDVVAAGQALVILEAMKMENELRAEHAGVVREVLVSAGTPVDAGAPLLVIDPPP